MLFFGHSLRFARMNTYLKKLLATLFCRILLAFFFQLVHQIRFYFFHFVSFYFIRFVLSAYDCKMYKIYLYLCSCTRKKERDDQIRWLKFLCEFQHFIAAKWSEWKKTHNTHKNQKHHLTLTKETEDSDLNMPKHCGKT